MAEHRTHQKPWRTWAGTPEDLVRLTADVTRVLTSAAGPSDSPTTWLTLSFKNGTDSRYETPEEFLAEFVALKASKVLRVIIACRGGHGARELHATVFLGRGWADRPSVLVTGQEPAVADGVTAQLSQLFHRSVLRRSGLREPGAVHPVTRLGRGLRWTLVVGVTAAITTAVTLLVTKWVG